MAGKKDRAVVAVISDLTRSQAAQISKDFMRAKDKRTSLGRGTIATGERSTVGSLIQGGIKNRNGG